MKALQEGLGGIRDVLLDGTQAVYCEAYGRADRQLRRAQGANVYLSQSPRYSMEALGMVLIAALAYVLSRKAGGLTWRCPCSAHSRLARSGCFRRCSRAMRPGR